MRTVLLLLALASAACSSRPRGAECESRMARLEARLSAAAAEPPSSLLIPPGLTPIELARGAPVDPPGPVLVVERGGGLTLAGRPIEAADLAARLTDGPLYLFADAAAPVAVLAAVLEQVPAQVEPRLVVVMPGRAPDPADRALAERASVKRLNTETAAADSSEKAAVLARHMEAAIEGCAPLAKAFGAIAGAEDKATFIARTAPAAARRCDCRMVDLELFEYALLEVFAVSERRPRWLPLRPFDPRGAATAAELAAQLSP